MKQIQIILDRLNMKQNDLIDIPNTKRKVSHFSRVSPSKGKARIIDILKYCVSFHFVPKKAFFKNLSESCPPNSPSKKELSFLCSKEGAEQYRKNWLKPPQPALFHILNTFPECQLSIDKLLEVLPPLPPRYYSANCSSKLAKKEIGFTVWILENGHASCFFEEQFSKMEEKEESEKLPLFKRPSSFTIDPSLSAPILLAGGIIPFRVFLQERELFLK